MKLAVVGAGISGLTAAWYLSRQHDVTLFEAQNYLGGHTDTHDIDILGKTYHVDSGFIVFNEHNYPNFSRLLDEWQVTAKNTEMSFSVDNALSGLLYNATSLSTLFCQKKNLVSPRFYRMLWDLIRFYRHAPAILEQNNQQTLGAYLSDHNYSDAFIHDHILPMACALWSGPVKRLEQMPVRYLVAFMQNHKMLSLIGRPQWKVVEGGSQQYVRRFTERFTGKIEVNSPVKQVQRVYNGVVLDVLDQKREFDAVIFACHSDQALQLLADPTADEQMVLGNIQYQNNHMQLHADESVLPDNRAAWASWNVHIDATSQDECTVSYHMNTLQRLDAPIEFIVSLNAADRVNADKVFVERHYAHPVYTEATLASQQRWQDISGHKHTYYCGAYWGWGFHEDGVNSARRVVQQFKAAQP